ncbi:MAG: PDZ domain-containing protein [Thermomicrobiales bacterium]
MKTVKSIADQLVVTGQVVRPYLGIAYVAITPSIAAQLGVDQTSGVYAGEVRTGSPAAKAGLQPEDIITSVDGQSLELESSLADPRPSQARRGSHADRAAGRKDLRCDGDPEEQPS